MIDALEFVVVLFALLLVEGFTRLDPPSLLWRRVSGLCKASRPNLYPGTGSWGWRYEWPFRRGLGFHSHLPPLALDALGVASGAKEFRKRRSDGKEAQVHLLYDELRKVEAVDRELQLNDVAVVCQSAQHAAYYARVVEKLRKMEEEQRPHWIRSELARICSAKEASVRLTRVEGAARPLWFLGLCLWLFLVLAFPLMALFLGINLATLAGAAIAFALSITIAVSYRTAFRKIFGDDASASWADVLRFALYPVSATKAADEVAREAFPDLHPIAFGDKAIAKQELKRAWYWTSTDASPSARQEWFYDCLRGEIEGAIRKMGLEPEAILKPQQAAEGSQSYCPRCETEYRFAAGTCPDCAGVAVVRLEPRG